MKVEPLDQPLLKYLKQKGMMYLKQKFVVEDIHHLVLFINPKYKSLLPLDSVQKSRVHAYARALVSSLSSSSASCTTPCNPSTSSDHTCGAGQGPSTSANALNDQFLDWHVEATPSSTSTDKIDAYVECTFELEMANRSFYDCDNQLNLVVFWSDFKVVQAFPKLSGVALGILSIPASSAASERAFSISGASLSKNRSQLSHSSVDSLVVLHSAKKFKYY